MSAAKTQKPVLYTFDVVLIGGPVSDKFIKKNPVISRTIAIRGDQTFAHFHNAIFKAFGREEEHMFEFQIGGKGPMDPNAKRYVSDESDEEMISALSASVLSMGERAANDLKRGVLDQVYIKGDQGYLLIVHCGPDALLSLLVKPEAKLGVVFMEAKRTAEELSKLFE